MTKKFLVIQLRPEKRAADSEFEAILQAGDLDSNQVDRWQADERDLAGINLDQYQAMIVGGSPFGVTTPPEEKSALQQQIEAGFSRLIPEVIRRDFPFLGACSGNGLLSWFSGGQMGRRFAEPVGGVDVYLTEAGQKDKLLQGFPSPFRALVGHKEACELPPSEAVVLATSSSCPVQMMRIGENVYSTQFHPEADADEIKLRIDIYKNYGYFPPEQADELKQAVDQEEIQWPQMILRRFVEYYSN